VKYQLIEEWKKKKERKNNSVFEVKNIATTEEELEVAAATVESVEKHK
jgi:hypothetical protein